MSLPKETQISTLSAESLISEEILLEGYDGEYCVLSSDDIRKIIEKEEKITHNFNIGLSRVNDAIGGFETGELIAVGGPTKNGKTLFAQTLTVNLQSAGVNCLWFTFEVPVRQFLAQMPKSTVFFLPKKLQQGKLDWLRDRIWEGKIKHNSQVVFIDNLHHLIDFSTVKNVSLDMGVVIRFLKRLAVELNVVIVILCHSKKPASNEVQEVSEWDLRDSSFIPQEADSTIMVQRKKNPDVIIEGRKMPKTEEYSNKAIIKVCLHRRTGTMGKVIHVAKVGNLLEEDITKYD